MIAGLLIGAVIGSTDTADLEAERDDMRAQLGEAVADLTEAQSRHADAASRLREARIEAGAAPKEAREEADKSEGKAGGNDDGQADADAGPEPDRDQPVVLKVNVRDDTRNKAPDAEIWACGHGSFHPDLDFGRDSVEMGITDSMLAIQPDGRGGREI